MKKDSSKKRLSNDVLGEVVGELRSWTRAEAALIFGRQLPASSQMPDEHHSKPMEARPRSWRAAWSTAAVLKPVLSITAVLVCLTGQSAAQPAPVPATSPSPEAAPVEPPSPEAPPEPVPTAPSTSKTAPADALTFGPPSQCEAPKAPQPRKQPAPGHRLSEDTALALSLGGTVAAWSVLLVSPALDLEGRGLAVTLLGTLLAPNLGHWYRGSILTRGTGLRVLGGLAAAYAIFRSMCDGCSGSDPYIFLGGAVLYMGATVDDILTAPRRVREHNRRLDITGLAPMVTNRGAGVALGGRF